jgi:hypothetical protein
VNRDVPNWPAYVSEEITIDSGLAIYASTCVDDGAPINTVIPVSTKLEPDMTPETKATIIDGLVREQFERWIARET